MYNAQRTSTKQPLIAGRTDLKYPTSEHIQLRVFNTDKEEAVGIATEIVRRERGLWGQISVLARTKALLEAMHTALRDFLVPSVIAQRRDEFLSPEFRWLVAVMRQLTRPLDRRNVATMIEAFNRAADIAVLSDQVIAEAEATGSSYLATWIDAAVTQGLKASDDKIIRLISQLVDDPAVVRTTLEAIVAEFETHLTGVAHESDLGEDIAAWKELSRDIAGNVGRNAPLDQFLQELQLRSKEPTPKADAVKLMTIHGAKGKEFDFVYVIGLAEDIMPSFQAREKGDKSPEMEEERRNCFVAITRTKECLVLSRAKNYRGWAKKPSRFLIEMGLVQPDEVRKV